MGYTTDFTGEFGITPALSPEHKAYLKAFANNRHITRDPRLLKSIADPIREAVGLPVGGDGCYFIGEDNRFGFDDGPGVTDGNQPPGTTGYMGSPRPGAEQWAQPGPWCQWVPNEDGTALEWDGGEKFYEYVPWLEYLIEHFLTPWGYSLAGEVHWQGEDSDDRGRIRILSPSNQVIVEHATITYS